MYSLNDKLDVIFEVAVVIVDRTVAIRQDPHLHGTVGAAGEDVIGRSRLDLHDAGAQVPEERLTSMFIRKVVNKGLCGQAPDLDVAL